MARYHAAFESLAERGEPVGPTAMAMLVREELENPARIAIKPARRRLVGPVVAVLAFLAVLIALVPVLLSLRGSEEPDVVEPLGPPIEWVESEIDDLLIHLASGPTGILVARGFEPVVALTSDGSTWTDVPLPDSRAYAFTARLAGGDAGWVLVAFTGFDPSARAIAWASTDGQTWTVTELPEEAFRSFGQLLAGAGGFLLSATRVDNPIEEWWWSPDGLGWESVAMSGLPEVTPTRVASSPAGFAAWDESFLTPDEPGMVYTSFDGRTWEAAEIRIPDEVAIHTVVEWRIVEVEMATDAGVLVAELYRTGAEPVTVVWVKDDEGWRSAPAPPFEVVDAMANAVVNLSHVRDRFVAVVADLEPLVGLGDVLYSSGDGPRLTGTTGMLPVERYALELFGSGSVGRVQLASTVTAWETADGIHWENSRDFGGGIIGASVADVEGELIGMWLPESAIPDVSLPPTSSVAPPPDPGPPDEVDPDGIALQETILADGVMTRVEFESAVARMARCYEQAGTSVHGWSVDPRGGYTIVTDEGDRVAERRCEYSYLGLLPRPGES